MKTQLCFTLTRFSIILNHVSSCWINSLIHLLSKKLHNVWFRCCSCMLRASRGLEISILLNITLTILSTPWRVSDKLFRRGSSSAFTGHSFKMSIRLTCLKKKSKSLSSRLNLFWTQRIGASHTPARKSTVCLNSKKVNSELIIL